MTGTAQQHISGLIAAAKAFQAGSKQRGPAGTNVIAGLQAQRDAIAPVVAPTPGVVSDPSGAEDKVIADILNDACMALNAGCFGAGTRLLTRRGWVPVGHVGVRGALASRTDRGPGGEVEWKPVEACFRPGRGQGPGGRCVERLGGGSGRGRHGARATDPRTVRAFASMWYSRQRD